MQLDLKPFKRRYERDCCIKLEKMLLEQVAGDLVSFCGVLG